MIHVILSLIFLVCCTSCSPPCCDYSVYGVDEFVTDSYKIRQGKQAILEMEGYEVEDLPEDTLWEYKDVIAEDDILNIVVYHPTRKDLMESIHFLNESVGGFKVHQGMIDLPDIPPVFVKGLSLEEGRIRLRDAYQEQIHNLEVFITYRDRLTRKVEIIGLTQTATVPVDGKMRLYEVLAKAHIPNNANLFMSYVMRGGCPLPIDLHQLINQGDMCQNIVMRGGDKIFIASPTDAMVMLMGEIASPRPIPVPYGFISLREALVTAGGIPYTGDRQRIQVIRGNLQCPKIYVVAWEHIIHLPNDSLLLMPGDTVFVSETPITKWNRFIDQLLPSYTGFQAGYFIYGLSK